MSQIGQREDFAAAGADRVHSPERTPSGDEDLTGIRSQIRDLASEVNSYKARAGGAFGASLFLILLSAGAGYDLAAGRMTPWLALGLDQVQLIGIAATLGFAGLVLVFLGAFKLRPAARRVEARLAQIEREYDELLDRHDDPHR